MHTGFIWNSTNKNYGVYRMRGILFLRKSVVDDQK